MGRIKFFLSIFISLFLFMPNVFAYDEWPSKISLTLNSSALSTTNRVFTYSGKLTFNLSGGSVFVPTYDNNQIKYGYISVCQAITHPIDTYSSGIYTKDFKVYETSIPCSMYGTTAYPDSRVIYMTFELNLSDGFMCSTGTSTTYCNLDNDLYIQQDGTNEWTLNSYGFSSEPFKYDSSESTIIDQNSQIIDKQEQTNNKLDEANKTSKGIWDTIKNLPNQLADMFSGLFIPEEGYFTAYFDELYNFFVDKLGILLFPIDLFLDVLDRFLNLEDTSSGLIHIPSISLGSFGELIGQRDFYINEYWDDEPYATLYNVYLVFVHAFIGFCLYRLASKKYKEIVGSGNSDS